MQYILDDNGDPIPCDDVLTWAEWIEMGNNRRVAFDEINGVKVSTVFLGLDHSFGSGPPLLYETMIFGGPRNDYQARYSTREEAVAGHRHEVWLALNPDAPNSEEKPDA